MPIKIEDALGQVYPFPSEFDYEMLIVVIRQRFQKGVGSEDVVAGNFELCMTNRRSQLITAQTPLVPGTAITMAIIVSTSKPRDNSCPGSGCWSSDISPGPGGALIW
jgi:hypothetical protein